jgi:DNA polymerase (family 10)
MEINKQLKETAMNSQQIADVFQEIALLMALKGENPFKIRAYERGAEVVLSLEDELDGLIAGGELRDQDGIGEALAGKIETLHAGGRVDLLEQLRREIPSGLVEMLRVPGLGPGRIRTLNKELGVESVDALEEACRDGRVATLKGFGEKSSDRMLRGIRWYRENLS